MKKLKLSFSKSHLSIKELNSIELPQMTVITGLNGSGKSHFLQAIANTAISIESINKEDIALFNNQTFHPPVSGSSIDQKQLDEEYDALIKAFENKKKQLDQLVNKIESQIPLTEICANNNASYTRLKKEDFQHENDYLQYSDFLENFNRHISNLSASYTPSSTRNGHPVHIDYSVSFNKIANNLKYPVNKLSDIEFRNLLTPWNEENKLFPLELGKIFWDYHLKIHNNQYQRYLVEQGYKPFFTPLSDIEFKDRYGEKPWQMMNSVLSKYPLFDYHVNSPEGLAPYDTYQYQLISNSDKNVCINPQTLSSGEKTLMALMCMLFKMRINQKFPKLILFDEVDANLHPSMIKVFFEVIRTALIDNGSNVILVTHSPSSIAFIPDESIYVLHKIGKDRLVKASQKEALNILTEGYATLEQGLTLFEQEKETKLLILTEGRNTHFIKKLLNLNNIQNVEIVFDLESMTGTGQLKTLYNFFSKTSPTYKILFILDCDAKVELSSQGNILSYYLPKNNENTIAQKGIENMFDEHLFEDYCVTTTMPNGDTRKSFHAGSKKEFEDFIINRSNKDDFNKFEDLLALIKNLTTEPADLIEE